MFARQRNILVKFIFAFICILFILILYNTFAKSQTKVVVKEAASGHRQFSARHNIVWNGEKGSSKSLGISQIDKSIGYHDWCVKHQRNNLSYTFYADKHDVKEYVNRITPNLKIATEYCFVSRSEDINETILSRLPKNYIFKANHLSGGIAFVQNNVITCVRSPCPVNNTPNNLQYLQLLCNTWLELNYATDTNHELYYKDIQPKCMFEEMLGNTTELIDLKVFTFHGKPYFIETDVGRFIEHKRDFFTPIWTRIAMTKIPQNLAYEKPEIMQKPIFLKELLQFSETLAKQFIMMRVDFFAYGEKFAFAEFSPSHDNCNGQFSPIIMEKFYGYISETGDIHIDPEVVNTLL